MHHRIVNTLAIILKRMDYGETSRIVTLYTRADGKVSVLAKGARARSQRFGAALEPGSISSVVYYVRQTRELQTLTQADVAERFSRLTGSEETIAGAMHILDIVNTVSQPGDPHPELFDETARALRMLDREPSSMRSTVFGFRVKVAHVTGLSPSVSRCVGCGRDVVTVETPLLFDIQRGGIVCDACSGYPDARATGRPSGDRGSFVLNAQNRSVLGKLLNNTYEQLAGDSTVSAAWNDLDPFLRLYERYHVFHGRALRTEHLVQSFVR